MLLAAALLGGGLAFASPILSDDFESGVLSPSPGKWDDALVDSGCTGCSIGVGSTSAHRGTYGMFFVDSHNAAGGGVQGRAKKTVSSSLVNVYGRFWLRMTQNNNLGQAIIAQIVSTGLGDLPIMDLSINPGVAGGIFTIAGRDAIGQYVDDDTPFKPTLNRWYLVEFEVKGIGATNSVLRGYIDGSLKVQVPLDLSDATASFLTLGEPYTSDERFSGTFQFDDYRTDTAPMASRWALGVPSAPPPPGGCMPMTATLVDSISGSTATAPYAFVAALDHVGAAGSFYADPSCATPTASLSVSAGAQGGTVYFKPDASGTATLSIDFVDFLPASRAVLIPSASPSPSDAGSPDGPGPGAGSAPGPSGISPSSDAAPVANCPAENPLCGDDLAIGSSCAASSSGQSGMADLLFTVAAIGAALFHGKPARSRTNS